jgi:hypothetical protein
MRPSPIVPVTTTSGEPFDGTNPYDLRAAYDEIMATAASGLILKASPVSPKLIANADQMLRPAESA